jgi:hypothetical protein
VPTLHFYVGRVEPSMGGSGPQMGYSEFAASGIAVHQRPKNQDDPLFCPLSLSDYPTLAEVGKWDIPTIDGSRWLD